MIADRNAEVFQTIVPLKYHVKAENFSRYQCQKEKAKQIYVNTLTVLSASLYLNSIGWSTSLEESDSWNPALQTMMNVADLVIPSYGKVECRFVLKGDETVNIPPEVWSERIGYLIVEFDASLESCNIIGFLRRVTRENMPLSHLEAIADFPVYLSQQKRTETIQPATLNTWFSDDPNCQWKQLDRLFEPSKAMNLRSMLKTNEGVTDRLSREAQRVKIIRLKTADNLAIALILNIRPVEEQEYDISLTVCNSQLSELLPNGLEMIVIDCNSFPVMIAQANQTETIEFCFGGKLEEKFSVELALDEEIIVESFII